MAKKIMIIAVPPDQVNSMIEDARTWGELRKDFVILVYPTYDRDRQRVEIIDTDKGIRY